MDIQYYDLHTHTTASDGALTPEQLVARAVLADIRYLAITDHDTVRGIQALSMISIPPSLRLITGTELTCQEGRQMLHVVGLNVDVNHPAFNEHLDLLDQLRQKRAQVIAQRLVKQGLPDLLADAMQYAAGGQIGRPHFARAMVARGLVDDMSRAFGQYLGSGKAGDVRVDWPALETVLTLIARAGGISILAHPTRYNLTMTKVRALVARFKQAGGHGLEVSYPSITLEQQNILLGLARQLELCVSGGSDFHDPANRWTALGHFLPIPNSVPHVLDRILPNHIQCVGEPL